MTVNSRWVTAAPHFDDDRVAGCEMPLRFIESDYRHSRSALGARFVIVI
ncbi:MAG: hypothetical protein HOH36_05725 [Acidimicrobiaceae bacterium]|nr:hypothetical protein [Acidimicrobiaceae bacterium]